MLALLTSFNQYKHHPSVQGMTHAVVPIVGVMMGVLTWGFLKKAKIGLGWKNAMILLGVSFLTIIVLKIHPGAVIGVLLAGGLLFYQ